MIVGDIVDLQLLTAAVTGSDVVYNFAAVADLNDALDKPLQTVRTNVLGTV